MWNPESTDVESGIHSVESGIQDSLGLPYMGRQMGGHEVLSTASFNTGRPHSNCFQAANQYVFGWKNPFAFHQKTVLCCVLIFFHVKMK